MALTNNVSHKSVLVQEVLEYIKLKPNGVYLDVTFGAGGHTRALLEAEPTCHVIAVDWDAASLEMYGKLLQDEFPGRLTLLWGNFALIYRMLKKERKGHIDGILADFGTSQMQIVGREGFSVYRDTPLDMRMSPAHQQTTAAMILNEATEEELREIFWRYGEEKYTKQIARAIVQARETQPFQTTGQLVDLIERVVPKFHDKRSRIHPATRVFQALRICVNKELENITSFLSAAMQLLAPEGRLVCISFHSLEDRLVKQFFIDRSREGLVRIVTSKVVTASDDELEKNPSARSAKLRAVERLTSLL
jgi:16S rRNA (cytosine1402-N4)-methyltransferase